MDNSGFLINLTTSKKKKNSEVGEKSSDLVDSFPVIKSPEKGKKSNKARWKKKLNPSSREFDGSKAKSSFDKLHSSSVFTGNPEISSLSVPKQKGLSETLFSTSTFGDLDLHPHLVACLKQRLGVEKMTQVQERTIPLLLKESDVLVKSCTGSGKTLAYAVPVVQQLQKMDPKIKRSDGVFALVVVPTRELALQCFECFSLLTKAFTWIVPGYLIGGEKKKSEKARLRKGINILITTPGRLLDHLDLTACLSLLKLKWLVIDEADKLLEQGFEDSVVKIIKKCPNMRQTVLVSATLSNSILHLAGISLSNPVQVDIVNTTGKSSSGFEDFALPSSLKQFVAVVPSKLRLAVLSAFIVDNCLKGGFKGIIFMCSQNSVAFHYSLFGSSLAELLRAKGHGCKFFSLHGHLKQEERTAIFKEFKSVKEGILLCTDVAARGLDLPHVDWIVQYTAPFSAEIYIHRVGRTARIGKKGSSLLFLLPSETKFSHLLTKHKIVFEEVNMSKMLQPLLLIGELLSTRLKYGVEDCVTFLQAKYEKEVYSEGILHQSAKDAFASYVQSYASYPKEVRDILPFKELHLGHVAKSFCLREAPSQLGVALPNTVSKFNRKPFQPKPQKRKYSNISEYDSGLPSLKPSNIKTKKRKH
ncbi:probable ATP-dependent RNA helicase DDX31 [Uloborus diversus]|uniref:probable ATP-dependent RNA helicase DDX31 n=1 Tax=Uloborus diversus TaxID=327109 RepID=UPI0024090440|nr:probable ATP-dependent RNA helicase DDX31 [Uloborus diversus]